MRVLVCGGRDYSDYDKVYEVMNGIHFGKQGLVDEMVITCVIHGAAKGADSLGNSWARFRTVPIEAYPANWDKYGKRAGYIRNTQMLEEGKPDLVVAFPGGRGTAMMVDIARKAGVRVIEIV